MSPEDYLPQDFSSPVPGTARPAFFHADVFAKLREFFAQKGLAQLKREDKEQIWYQDWLDYQAQNKIYASLLSPAGEGRSGHFDLLKLVRFMEMLGFFSPAHGYSLQVSFLGIFPILMSANPKLREVAIAELNRGGLFAFGVSEKNHGSDLYRNNFRVQKKDETSFLANGEKFYIGNANCASIISILGRFPTPATTKPGKEEFIFFAYRPQKAKFTRLEKIETLGVRAAFVGDFEVENYSFSQDEVISQGQSAWDAIFGTVNLGKFFLGFGSVGICEHAFCETFAHSSQRILFNTSVVKMPHIRQSLAVAFARLCGMKLYAYRALDYLQVSDDYDRRYLLFNSVQKAKVSTEGVRVMAELSEVIGAKGFETSTYFEMAIRDAQLIPGLEGSAHINFGLTLQCLKNYLFHADAKLGVPPSCLGEKKSGLPENPYLFKSASGGLKDVTFRAPLEAYAKLKQVPNVALFASQVRAAKLFVFSLATHPALYKDANVAMFLGKWSALFAYAQLIAENCTAARVEIPLVNVIFHNLVDDLSAASLKTLGLTPFNRLHRTLLKRVIQSPATEEKDFQAVANLMERTFGPDIASKN